MRHIKLVYNAKQHCESLYLYTDVLIKCDEANGWISASSSCYKYYGSDYAWSDANNFCQAVGAELISVQSQEEQDVVTLQASVQKADIWIGATDLVSLDYIL